MKALVTYAVADLVIPIPDVDMDSPRTGDAGTKRMKMPKPLETYRDVTGHWPEPVTTDGIGEAEFRCPPGSVSVWCPC